MADPLRDPTTPCPTCGSTVLRCGTPWPPSLPDVRLIRCTLPRGHRSAEHWHAPIWPGGEDLVWVLADEA